jgi:uncharacterized protein involved in response to NO
MLLWVLMLRGDIAPNSVFEGSAWHIHEMIYGYVGAVIAGFLLTAVPNWTGIAAPKGKALAGLFSLWVLGRVAVLFGGDLPISFVLISDLSFLIIFEIFLVRALVKSGNTRNLVVAGIIALLILANGLSYFESARGVGQNFSLAMVIMLISLIGGRIIPNFTKNWLRQRGGDKLPAEFGTPDKLALLSSVLALSAFVVGWEGPLPALLFIGAGAMNLWRLSRWRGAATGPEPLVLVLHLAYLWLPVGYLLYGFSHFLPALDRTGALHALTTGAVGTMTLAVMTRATLGHSGRALTTSPGTTLIFVLITLATILRVYAGLFGEILGDAALSYALAGFAWALAFVVFVVVYGPMFFAGRKSP